MNKKSPILILLLALLLSASGCIQSQESETEKINAVVSILPQKEFVREVGKDKVNVQELIPPGASPATYNPKPSELASVENAKIYFRIGLLPFEEAHAETFRGLNPDMKIVSAFDVVELRHFGEWEEHGGEAEHGHDGKKIDPHIWLSPENAKKHVEQIYRSLAEIDPKNQKYYRKNADDYLVRLKALDRELKQNFSNIKTENIMVFHPSWGYLTDAYGLKQIAIEQSGKDPTAKGLAGLVGFAKENNVKVIFVQKQFSTQSAEALAAEIGAAVVQIDPLAENYLENLSKIGKEIAKRLS